MKKRSHLKPSALALAATVVIAALTPSSAFAATKKCKAPVSCDTNSMWFNALDTLKYQVNLSPNGEELFTRAATGTFTIKRYGSVYRTVDVVFGSEWDVWTFASGSFNITERGRYKLFFEFGGPSATEGNHDFLVKLKKTEFVWPDFPG